jgi:hypothetical protein
MLHDNTVASLPAPTSIPDVPMSTQQSSGRTAAPKRNTPQQLTFPLATLVDFYAEWNKLLSAVDANLSYYLGTAR